jgi:hypothetical protein
MPGAREEVPMPEDEQDTRRRFPWPEYVQGLRTGIRNNSTAYGYSILATVAFAALSSRAGSPELLDLFLFVAGGCLGFGLVEVVASRGFRDQLRGDRSDVVVIGSAIDLLSVAAGLAAVVGVTALAGGRVAWLAGPLTATVVYLLVNGLEMAFARRAERAREAS